MIEERLVGVQHLVEDVEAEHRPRHQKLERHVLVLTHERMALRAFEDQVGRHQAGRKRAPRQVVDRLGTVTHCMEQAEDVDRHVCEVAPAVVDDEVQIDIVGSAETAACQRTGDGDAADEGRESNERPHEAQGHSQVARRVGSVIGGARADITGAGSVRRLQNQVVGERELSRSCHRPPHLGFGHGPAKAQAAQAFRTEDESAPRQQSDGPADTL